MKIMPGEHPGERCVRLTCRGNEIAHEVVGAAIRLQLDGWNLVKWVGFDHHISRRGRRVSVTLIYVQIHRGRPWHDDLVAPLATEALRIETELRAS